MKCPNCNETLVMADRQGVEIDYCPKCRGVWLDRGELDKIIERSAEYESKQEPPAPPPPTSQPYSKPDYDRPYNQGHDQKYDPYYNKHKKKKGFLGDFFDFD
jgi:Zn-finger nucleic acid-binding protein